MMGLNFNEVDQMKNDSKIRISFNEEARNDAKIKVIGVGGGGGNAVNRMIEAGLKHVEFIAANTDAQALRRNKAPMMVQLGPRAVVSTESVSFPDVGSLLPLAETEAVSWRVPCATAATVMWIFAVPPLLIGPRAHVTTPADWVHAPWLAVAAPYRTCAGSVSCAETSVAMSGPPFVTVIV